MNLKMFSVYDAKAEVYITPFFFSTKGEALRAFIDTVSDRSHAFHRHAHDFSLFYLGDFDNSNAVFMNLNHPECLARAHELLGELAPIATIPELREALESGDE